MSGAVHVTPQDDLVEHDTASDGECVCGPTEQAHKTRDGRVVFWYVHHSLDGRESTEVDGAPRRPRRQARRQADPMTAYVSSARRLRWWLLDVARTRRRVKARREIARRLAVQLAAKTEDE